MTRPPSDHRGRSGSGAAASPPRNIHAAPAAGPRPVSADYPRRGRRRDSSPPNRRAGTRRSTRPTRSARTSTRPSTAARARTPSRPPPCRGSSPRPSAARSPRATRRTTWSRRGCRRRERKGRFGVRGVAVILCRRGRMFSFWVRALGGYPLAACDAAHSESEPEPSRSEPSSGAHSGQSQNFSPCGQYFQPCSCSQSPSI